ncbi:MAG: DEAD/DEAH box helicase [Vibrio splendidus]
MLSYKVDSSESFSGALSWDGHSSFYNMRENKFPAGFVRMIKKKLELQGHKVHVARKPVPEPLGETLLCPPNWEYDPRYDYQPETVRRLINLKSIIAQCATGSGKSVICQLAYLKIKRPTLFITTRKTLMYQMAEGFESISGIKSGIIGDGKYSPAHITCATVDTLVSRLEVKSAEDHLMRQVEIIEEEADKHAKRALRKAKLPTSDNIIRTAPSAIKRTVLETREKACNEIRAKYPKEEMWQAAKLKSSKQIQRRKEMIEFLKTIEFVVLEEAHEISGNGYYDMMQQCTNAHYRLALTATPFLKDSQEANMRLMAATGPVGIKVSERKLIDRGILARPYFRYVNIPPIEGLNRGTPWQKAYKLGIVENTKRNLHIINECRRARRYGLPVMILVQHQDHGKRLEKVMNKLGIKTRFIYGEHEQKERKSALDALKTNEIEVLIGSTILDVGVDCPAIGLVILAGGGKAEVSLRQRIGRGLRAKKIGPNVCFVMDFMDTGNNHLIKHSRMRRDVVETTDGFKQGIMRGGFEYEKHGFMPK